MAAPLVPPPQVLFNHPMGQYGISYDIGTNATERDLPHGWNAARGGTYRQLISRLRNAGYRRHQYSDYRSSTPTAPWITWLVMWSLRNIQPPMKFQSTVKGCKMQFYRSPALYDISVHTQLGGIGAPNLLAITPAGLVITAQQRGAVLNPPPAVPNALPGPAGALPYGTRPSQNAVNPGNWRL